MLPTACREHHGNPGAIHSFGRTTRAAVGTSPAHQFVVELRPGEIIFTSGGTADNMCIFGSVRDLGVENVITSPIEHRRGGVRRACRSRQCEPKRIG